MFAAGRQQRRMALVQAKAFDRKKSIAAFRPKNAKEDGRVPRRLDARRGPMHRRAITPTTDPTAGGEQRDRHGRAAWSFAADLTARMGSPEMRGAVADYSPPAQFRCVASSHAGTPVAVDRRSSAEWSSPTAAHGVSQREALSVWLRIALLSFGGPAGQIATMHRILVDEKRWISERRFLHALNYCMLLPGPEAQQLATYIGWLMHGTRGGLIAGGLFILPGVLAILALSMIYVSFGQVGISRGAVLRAEGRGAGDRAAGGGAARPPRLEDGCAARAGRRRLRRDLLLRRAVSDHRAGRRAAGAVRQPRRACRLRRGDASWRRAGRQPARRFEPDHSAARSAGATLRVAAIWLVLWLSPVALLLATLGPHDVFSQIAVFFSKMAMVTFGGAYAVLAYVAQQAVDSYGWLTPREMLDGLGTGGDHAGPADHGAAIRRLSRRVP